MHIFSLVAAVAALHGSVDRVEVPLQNITAAFFMKRRLDTIKLGTPDFETEKPKVAIPDDQHVYISANLSKNTLILEGPKGKLEGMSAIIRLFDVKPKKIQLELKMNDSEMGLVNNVTLDCDNNDSWVYANDSMGLQMRGTPRINADGTITLKLKTFRESSAEDVVFRMKSGKPVGINALEGADRVATSPGLRIAITLKATIQE